MILQFKNKYIPFKSYQEYFVRPEKGYFQFNLLKLVLIELPFKWGSSNQKIFPIKIVIKGREADSVFKSVRSTDIINIYLKIFATTPNTTTVRSF